MRWKWYKIPGFDKYEIRGDLQIRNVKTGRLKGSAYRWEVATLYGDDNKPVRRIRTSWLQLAKDSLYNYKWVTIYGFSMYEMLENGTVRNRRTKRHKQSNSTGCYKLMGDDGNRYHRSKAHLVWLMFGRRTRRSRLQVPVAIECGACRLYFDNLSEALRYIARECGRPWYWVRNHYYIKKELEIGGWRKRRMN